MSQAGLVAFNSYITHSKTSDYLHGVLGSRKEAFVSNIVSLVSNNVKLQECVPATIMYSAIKATSLRLPLDNNLGFAYVLPYRNNAKGITEAQFQIGYKGFIQLAMRSGQFKTLNVTDVRKGEIQSKDRLSGEFTFNWIEDEEERNNAPVIGYVSYFRLTNGFEKSLYMTDSELNKHAKEYSKTYGKEYSNWTKMFEAMASKTVLKLLISKYAPLSTDMQKAVEFDQSVIREDGKPNYIDNEQKTVDIEALSEEEQNARITKFIDDAKTIEDCEQIRESLSPELLTKFASDIDDKQEQIILSPGP